MGFYSDCLAVRQSGMGGGGREGRNKGEWSQEENKKERQQEGRRRETPGQEGRWSKGQGGDQEEEERDSGSSCCGGGAVHPDSLWHSWERVPLPFCHGKRQVISCPSLFLEDLAF